MLSGADQHAMAHAAARAAREPQQGEVVRFGRPRGEDDFISVRTDQPRDPGGCLIHGARCFPSDGVIGGMWIAERFGKIRRHFGKNTRIYRRGRLMVEIYCVSNFHLASMA